MKTNKNENRITMPEKLLHPRRFASFRKTIPLLALLLLVCVGHFSFLLVGCDKHATEKETILYYSDKNTEVSMKWIGETTPPLDMWVPGYTHEPPPYINSFDQLNEIDLNQIKEFSEKRIKVKLYPYDCDQELEEMQYVGYIFNHYSPNRQDLAVVYKIREHKYKEEGSASTEFYFFIELENMCLHETWRDLERSKLENDIRSYYSTHYPYPETRGAQTIEEIREMVIADGDLEKTQKDYPDFTYEDKLDPMYT